MNQLFDDTTRTKIFLGVFLLLACLAKGVLLQKENKAKVQYEKETTTVTAAILRKREKSEEEKKEPVSDTGLTVKMASTFFLTRALSQIPRVLTDHSRYSLYDTGRAIQAILKTQLERLSLINPHVLHTPLPGSRPQLSDIARIGGSTEQPILPKKLSRSALFSGTEGQKNDSPSKTKGTVKSLLPLVGKLLLITALVTAIIVVPYLVPHLMISGRAILSALLPIQENISLSLHRLKKNQSSESPAQQKQKPDKQNQQKEKPSRHKATTGGSPSFSP